jgi:NADH-quinone oxidoreductase subunit A
MLSDFGFVFVFFLLGIVFVGGALIVAKLIRPANPTPEKLLPYECGEDPIGPQWMKFNIRFYLVALIFLLFDVELVLLFPWAVVFQKLGMYAYIAGALFIVVLFLADFYLWAKGDLEWVRPQPVTPVFDDIVDRVPVRSAASKPADGQSAAPVTEPA